MLQTAMAGTSALLGYRRMLPRHASFYSLSMILQETLSPRRDEEVTSGMVGATHRLGFHFPAFATVSKADSCPPSLRDKKEWPFCLGPLTFGPKSSWHSAGVQVFLSRTGRSLKVSLKSFPTQVIRKSTSRHGHKPQRAVYSNGGRKG